MRILSLACNAALLATVLSIPAVGQQNSGYLKTNVNPGRAGVFIDGKYMSDLPRTFELAECAVAAGEHEVRLSEPRYEDIVKKVTIESGKTTKVAETMKALPPAKPPFGTLRVYLSRQVCGGLCERQIHGPRRRVQQLVAGSPTESGRIHGKGGAGQWSGGKEEHIKIETDKVTIVHSVK